jgi:hypothetical protein
MGQRCFRNLGKSMLCFALMFVTGCATGLNESYLMEEASTPPARTYSVSRFGAKGDGIHDDSFAIQKTLNAAVAGGGGIVSFPCGEFSIQSAEGGAPAERSLLYLRNASAIKLLGQGSCTHLFTTLAQKSVIEFEDSNHITISALRITAFNAVYVETYGMDGGSAVRFSGVAYGSISNVEVDGAAAGALYFTKGTSHSLISNNNIHDTYGSGIWEDDCGAASATSCAPASPPQNNVYQSNTLTNTALAAMFTAMALDDGSASSFAIVKGNTISWTRSPLKGFEMVHCIQISNASDISILNNTCIATPYDGIVITVGANSQAQRDIIQGNIIQSTGSPGFGGSGIVLYSDTAARGISGFVISGNSITTAAGDGIRTASVSGQGSIYDGQILNNTISMVDQLTPGRSYGINVRNSDSIIIRGNSIKCNGHCIGVGVTVVQSTNTRPAVSDNTVTDILGPPLFIF